MTNQELNEAVARKLGWVKLDKPDYSLSHPHYWKKESGGLADEVPAYSTSIEAAWELTEKVPYFFLMKPLKNEKWKCDMATADHTIIMYTDTAPLAICKAFLKLP